MQQLLGSQGQVCQQGNAKGTNYVNRETTVEQGDGDTVFVS